MSKVVPGYFCPFFSCPLLSLSLSLNEGYEKSRLIAWTRTFGAQMFYGVIGVKVFKGVWTSLSN